MRNAVLFAAAAVALGLASAAVTSGQRTTEDFGLKPATLAPIRHHAATLVVSGSGSEHVYSNAELEKLPTYQLKTSTPWREDAALFEGVLLSDVLQAHGLADAESIRFTAENDYIVDIRIEDIKAHPALIATRINGAPLSRDLRGPFYLVFPLDHAPETGGDFSVNWVWMIARISETPAT